MYNRDKISNDLSKEETNRLMHFFISKIGTDNKKIQECQEEYLKKLIQQKSKISELNPKQVEFISKFVNNRMLNSRLKELGYNKDDIQNNIYIGKNEAKKNLGGFESNYNIYINKVSTLTDTIPSLMQVVCHETEHSIQRLEAEKNPKSKAGLDLAISNVLRDYFSSTYNYKVYNNNYRFEPIERDAENTGYRQAITFLNTFGFQNEAQKLYDKQRKKLDSRRFEYDYRIDENGKKSVRERFLFNNLNKVIAKNPDIINKYPSLSSLYTQDGKVKSFEDIITNDYITNDNSKSTNLEDFCKYYISRGALNNLDLSKFPEKVQANIASRLISILGEEGSQISMMGENNLKHQNRDGIDKNSKKYIEKFHLKNSKNIMKFMNKNYQHLMNLQDKGLFSSMMDMSYYDSNTKCFRTNDIFENLVYDIQDHKDDLIQLGLEAMNQKEVYRNNKKQKFNSNTLETSFDSLINDSKLSDFQNATRGIKELNEREKASNKNLNIKDNESKLEEK